jgi:hypothetical protein
MQSDAFMRSGLDCTAAPPLHNGIQGARRAVAELAAAGEGAGPYIPSKGDAVQVRLPINSEAGFVAGKMGAAWRKGKVVKTHVRKAKANNATVDVEVGADCSCFGV